ncbi:MAG: UDP-N-acetylglucosamine--N-acetylmuramyl-(pentapeptide) pyrophosphoryl-undecaprenol N-acetylglucosamine transferase [Bifidobacteriaceae bacterium]|jgi:UDP-N-acetylglucosamine--N-acetylmuramyl-(pentapeptide) pyrophosphoryl-undecaprenol N-acetylglucosamine transferase|nr:UDP-N-acetylglucosamine--N-acetylmuramyl-(pentapeptide) pyrophosphoryl-undecaprenol N-acetylglucosamine transferase [Bifidobacteriaceae bacterium]
MKVVLAGGGTFGHVGPLLATAAELRRRRPDVALQVVGTAEGLEARMVPAAGLELAVIPKAPFPRRLGREAARFPARWVRAMRLVNALIRDFRPDVVVGFGGYVCPPAYRAAVSAGVPVVVHEANARPGLANRWGAKHAAAVGVAFAGTPLPHARLVGMPLRRELAHLNRAAAAPAARQHFGLELGRPTLLVAGGSLGALRLNRAIVGVAGELLDAGAQVLHLAGRGKGDEVRAAVEQAARPDGRSSGGGRYVVLDYLEQMELALAAADLAVQRAGAASVAELACAALPAVLVPLGIGNGEQRLNAAPLVDAAAAVLVPDDALAAWAPGKLVELLTSPERLAAMSSAASSVAIRDGAERLVDMIEEVVC